MTVRRIVANLVTPQPRELVQFYRKFLGLDIAMDLGWIATLVSNHRAHPQVSIVTQDGTQSEMPELSVEVDDAGVYYARAKAMDIPIEYGLTDEDWGVRRFFVRDPSGRLVNILSHRPEP